MYLQIYKCNECGQTVAMIKGTGIPMVCCNLPMKYVRSSDEDTLKDKHVPLIKEIKDKDSNKVEIKVGNILHPSDKSHYIDWIALETNKGVYFRNLKPGDIPTVTFTLDNNESVVDVFCYCNLHGLWKNSNKHIH